MRWRWMIALLFAASSAAQAGIGVLFDDPLGSEAGLPAHPGEAWKGVETLPALRPLASWTAADASKVWSLPALSAFALAHNPQTAAAWESLRAQAAWLGMAESAWLPSLTLNTSARRAQAVATNGFSVPARNSVNPSFTLSYTLWEFGLRRAKVDAAQAQEWVAGYTQNQTLQTVVFNVTQAYYNLLGNEALLHADERSVAENEKALEAAEVLHRAGQATIGDLYQARASLAQAQSTLAAQQQAVTAGIGSLAAAIGVPPDSQIQIAPLQWEAQGPPQLQQSVEELLHSAEKVNPALLASRAQLAAAQANVRSARASGLPSLAFTGTYGYQFQSRFNPGDTWTLGLTLTVPLFTGFNNHYQVRQNEALAREDAANLVNTRLNTLSAVWQDYHNFQGSVAAYPGAAAGLANARKALEVVIAQYKVGQATIQDVLQAEATLAQDRYTLISDLVKSYVGLATLSQAVGMPLGDAQP
ncbi:MAG: TolC family protein [Acidithiobacillus sp.]|nr:TolC family protein [Acidithiobacillus sp.]